MSNQTKLLLPYAMQEANAVKLELPSEFSAEMAAAYDRARSYSAMDCPRCWVRGGNRFGLEERAIAKTATVLGCEKCEFEIAVDGKG